MVTDQDGWQTLDHESTGLNLDLPWHLLLRIGNTSWMEPRIDFEDGLSRHLRETRASAFPTVTETVGLKDTTCRGGPHRCLERSEGVIERDGSKIRHRTGGIGGHGTGETKEQMVVCQPPRTALVRGNIRR